MILYDRSDVLHFLFCDQKFGSRAYQHCRNVSWSLMSRFLLSLFILEARRRIFSLHSSNIEMAVQRKSSDVVKWFVRFWAAMHRSKGILTPKVYSFENDKLSFMLCSIFMNCNPETYQNQKYLFATCARHTNNLT